MTSLILAAVFFLALHLVVSASGLRAPLIGLLGERAYRVVFALASLGGVAWLAKAYGAAPAIALWDAGLAGRAIALGVMPVAALLVVAGLAAPNPTALIYLGSIDAEAARGIFRITRHPVMTGIALWAAVHLIANGDLASVLLFGTFLVTALFGPPVIDRRRARQWGASWAAFAAVTSVVPFAAIAAGRNRFVAGEIGWWRLGLGLLLFAVLLAGHRWAFGLSPLAG